MVKLGTGFPVFVLEGAAFAGKTTLLNKLREVANDKLILIPEVGEYVGGDKNFPDVPFKDIEAAQYSTYFFAELERIRCEDARQGQARGKSILMDRSTPLSSLVFYKLLMYHAKNKRFVREFYSYAVKVFAGYVRDQAILPPTHLIYLRPKNKRVFMSRLSRGTKNNVFSSWGSFCYLNDLYMNIISLYFKNRHIVLQSENSTENLNELADQVLSYIKANGALIKAGNPFENFMQEGRGMPFPNKDIEKRIAVSGMKMAQRLVSQTGLKI